jgi:hypothetical protein
MGFNVAFKGLRVLNDTFRSEDERNASTRTTSGSNNYFAKVYKPKDLNAQYQCCGNFKLRKIQSSLMTFGCVSQSRVMSEKLPYFQEGRVEIYGELARWNWGLRSRKSESRAEYSFESGLIKISTSLADVGPASRQRKQC